MHLKEKLRKCKNGDLEVEEYRQENKIYKNWIERKKNEWNEKILEEIENDKSEKNFWKVVNELKELKRKSGWNILRHN